MIKKTIFAFLLLFTLYTIFVLCFAPKWWHASQHQWQDNIVKAQNFLYSESDTFQNIVVGSSLSNRIIIDSIPGTYSLSFAGQGVLDGLTILNHKLRLPKNIFIEMNFILRKENKNFTSTLFSPILFYPRKSLPSLRDDKQPVAIIGSLIYIKMKGLALKKIKSDEPKRNDDNTIFSKMLKLQIADYSQEPNKEIVNDCFNTLKNDIIKLENKGVNVIFFEMPVDAQLENLPKARIIRQTFYKYFSTQKYKYISIPNAVEYKTSDGLHLNRDEALKYTVYFRSEIKNLSLK